MKPLLRVVFGLLGLFLAWVLVSDEPFAFGAKPDKDRKDGSAATSREPALVAAEIDKIINAKLAEEKIPASPICDDAEFIRRASLDIRGRVPSMERTVGFLNDKDPNKRTKLIDEFLADSEYGEHFAIIWYHRIVKPDDDNRLLIAGNKLQDWLEDSFNQNRGWNKIAFELLTASGDRDENPPVTFFLAHVNDNKNHYEPAPNKLTTASSRMFFGVKLECCECHNHPYNTMKQTDYWGVAAFFGNTHAEHSSKKDAKAGITATVHEGKASVTGGGKKAKDKEVVTSHAAFGSIEIPDSKGKTVRAKFLNAEMPSFNAGQALRPVLAKWLTSEQNPFFARALVNKMWANFFGRGIINPVDDMSDEDKATHPEVLKLLADEFVASGFDLKHLIRCICLSETYQRSSQALPSNKDDDDLYSHMKPKVLSADMLFDSLAVVLGRPVGGDEGGKAKGQKKYGGGPRAAFRKFFHAEADDDVGVVEEYTHGIPQALKLLNAPGINNTNVTVSRIRKSADGQNKVIECIYLTVLSRVPTEAEVKKLKEYAAQESNAYKAYNDMMWALLNSAEFMFNH
jgi:hypothetical protein